MQKTHFRPCDVCLVQFGAACNTLINPHKHRCLSLSQLLPKRLITLCIMLMLSVFMDRHVQRCKEAYLVMSTC